MSARLRPLLALALIGAAPPDRVFDAVWRDVRRDYWDARLRGVDWDAARARFRPQALAARDPAALYTVINAMLDRLGDSHVFAVAPGEVRYERATARGAAQPDFGFASYREADGWLVFAVTPGSSAARAGVKPGWTLLTIDGRPIDVDRHPAAGEQARLVFRDETGVTLTRDLVAALAPPVSGVRARMLAGDVLLIAVDGFDDHEDRGIAQALRDHGDARAVILDLRDNDGGEEGTAARAAGLFYAASRTMLVRIDRRRETAVPIAAAAHAWRGPLAVLVGPRSASAAEALAALFDESDRAITVGARTAGALTGATIETLPDGGRLSVATSDVRTPGGRRIEGIGFVPRYPVADTPADMAAGRDPVLAAALRRLDRPSGRRPPSG